MSLRDALAELEESAAAAGYPEADRLGTLTPAEITLRLKAYTERLRGEWERADAQAWLTGRYVALGLCAPSRYPSRPAGRKETRAAMSEAEIKAVFEGMR